jgi:hypothetical protein
MATSDANLDVLGIFAVPVVEIAQFLWTGSMHKPYLPNHLTMIHYSNREI